MENRLEEQLAQSVIRFKKVGITLPADVNIHIGEFFVMSKIARSSVSPEYELSPADIQKRLHITKPAVSQMYNSLEKKGYILREIDTNDRRKFVVTLTPEGQGVLERVKRFYDKRMSETISRFGEENTIQLIDLINRFTHISEELDREMLKNGKGDD